MPSRLTGGMPVAPSDGRTTPLTGRGLWVVLVLAALSVVGAWQYLTRHVFPSEITDLNGTTGVLQDFLQGKGTDTGVALRLMDVPPVVRRDGRQLAHGLTEATYAEAIDAYYCALLGVSQARAYPNMAAQARRLATQVRTVQPRVTDACH